MGPQGPLSQESKPERVSLTQFSICSTFWVLRLSTSLSGQLKYDHPAGAVLGGSKSLYGCFRKIKGTLFIFTSNFIDLGILSRLAVSHVVER